MNYPVENGLPDFDSFNFTALEEDIKSMLCWTALNERRFNKWYAKEAYKGDGEIVDLGCMTGSSTVSLAAGLCENKNISNKRIHAYDFFIKYWEPIPWEPLYDVPIGNSFIDYFLINIRPWKDYIKIYQGNVCELGWSGEPIEYLLVDIMKTWDTAKAVTCAFFPFLIPKKSFVVHQDFIHWYTPWIHIIMYRLRDCLEPVYEIPGSSTIIFNTKKTITREICNKATDFTSISLEEIDQVFRYSESLVSKNFKSGIKIANIMFFVHYIEYENKNNLTHSNYDKFIHSAVSKLSNINPEWWQMSDFICTENKLRQLLQKNINRYFLIIIKIRIISVIIYCRSIFKRIQTSIKKKEH
jgi:hypothetical protein